MASLPHAVLLSFVAILLATSLLESARAQEAAAPSAQTTSSASQGVEQGTAGVDVALPGVVVTAGTLGGIPLETETETASWLGLTIRETPATIDILTQAQMQELGVRSTLEALNHVPGVTSSLVATSPGLLSMRGFSGSAISLLYDGVKPATPGFFTRVQDSWLFERIEVLKGPSSVLYGEGALAGTVNLVPKRAHLGSNERSAQASYGSFDSYRVAGDANFVLGERAAIRAVGSYGQSDGYVDGTDSQFIAASISGIWQVTDRLTLDAAADYSEDDYDTAYLGTPLVPREFARNPSGAVKSSDGRVLDKAMRDVNYNVRDGIVDSETLWLRLGLKYRLTDAWNISNTFHHYSSDRRFINAEFFGFNPTTNLVDRSTGIVTHDFDYWIDRLMLTGDIHVGGLRNRVAVGAELSDVQFFTKRRFGSTTSVDPYDPDRGYFPKGDNAALFPSRTDNDNGIRTTAFFVEDALNLTPRWLLVAGLRWDHIEVDRVTENLNTSVRTPVKRDFRELTGRLGTVFDLQPHTQLFAQYSTAAVPPANLMSLTPANADFDLTTGDSIEGGIKSSFLQDRVTATFSAFLIRQKDIITRDPNDLTLSVQGGKQSSRGVELALSAAVTSRLSVDANYTILDARFDELIEAGGADRKGNTPARVPEQTGNLFVSYKVADTPVTLSGGLHYSGRFYTDNANTIRVGSYTTLEAAIGYRLPFGDLVLRGRNLTDELYADYTDMSPDQLTIGPRRSVELTLSVKF